MVETRALLGKIVALRQRLDQAQGLVKEAGSAAVALLDEQSGTPERVPPLEQQVVAGEECDAHLAALVRPLMAGIVEERRPLPRQLTARGRRVLERGRELLGQLRGLADCFVSVTDAETETTIPTVPRLPRDEPLTALFRETAAMADTALRLIPHFPDSATTQLQLCEGLDGILNTVGSRLRTLTAGVAHHQAEHARVARLAGQFNAALTKSAVSTQTLHDLAEEILTDARAGAPLRFAPADLVGSVRLAAGHGVSVARVIARLVRHDPELRDRPLEAVLAALVHDVGMANVSLEILLQGGPLGDEQRRSVEAHCRTGAEAAALLCPDMPELATAVLGHHERLDGTGYPDGLRAHQITPLARLLAVCDVYVAMASSRLYRPVREPRTALTDTLLLAEQGLLDPRCAELLLHLSFYPIGSMVELSDGSAGLVVATPAAWRDLNSPARPVVAVLVDADGRPHPVPHHVDLMHCEHLAVVRGLTPRERRERVGTWFPEWA
jgi:HD-GYP domain-containing protein (c-di-GMP phosphodiesterase class II)